jgi:hypothetical protein
MLKFYIAKFQQDVVSTLTVRRKNIPVQCPYGAFLLRSAFLARTTISSPCSVIESFNFLYTKLKIALYSLKSQLTHGKRHYMVKCTFFLNFNHEN